MSRLTRRVPLAPGAPLSRAGGLKRTGRLPFRSAKRAALRPTERAATQAMLARDGHKCMLSNYGVGPCSGRLTPHHLRKQSQGYDWSLPNLLTLCTLHNEWVERAPDVAYALGLVVRHGDSHADAWARMARRGVTEDRRR